MSIYGLILGIAFTIGIEYSIYNNRLLNKSQKKYLSLIIVFSSLLGARIYHVLDYWSYYSQNPNQILNTKMGGLGIYGGIIGGFISIYIFSKIYKIPILLITNKISTILPLCQAIGRVGNFFNKEISIWWLESILSFLLFLFIRNKNSNQTSFYLIGYGIIRIITELFRTDTWSIHSIKTAHVISLIMMFLGIYLLKIYGDPRGIRTPDCLDESQES